MNAVAIGARGGYQPAGSTRRCGHVSRTNAYPAIKDDAMRCVLFSLAGLSSIPFLFLLQGCISAEQIGEQPTTAPAPHEKLEGVTLDHPKGTRRSTREDDLIRVILAADGPSEAADGDRALFKHVGRRGLTQLQTHTSDTIAVQAAWMQVELTVPVKEPAQAVRPDREKLVWFLDFLERRAQVRAPKWWADALLDARANRRGNISSGRPNPFELWQAGAPLPENWPAKATIDRREGKLVVQLGKESEYLPDGFYEKLRKQHLHDEVRALFTPTRCYVAIHEGFGYGYRLGCFDRAPLKMRWVSDVWGSWWYASSGVCDQLVEIMEQGDRVVVFGDAVGFHVEAFQADDGANLFRFSNTYAME